MNEEQIKFELYLTILRFLTFKITTNLIKAYMDVDLNANKILLTAYYLKSPSQLELELLDDIVTNSNAHIPDFFINSNVKLIQNHTLNEKHDFIVHSFYDGADVQS